MAKRRNESDMIVVHLINEYNDTYFKGLAWIKDDKSMKELLENLENKGVIFKKGWFE